MIRRGTCASAHHDCEDSRNGRNLGKRAPGFVLNGHILLCSTQRLEDTRHVYRGSCGGQERRKLVAQVLACPVDARFNGFDRTF